MDSKEKLLAARSFLEELAEHPPQLPYEPILIPQLFAATREDSTASIDDLTEIIERSQNLASRVLTIANSAMYALESTVTSLRRAISVLGFREVRTLVIMLGAVTAIKQAKLPKTFDVAELWHHQLKTAAVAKTLVRELAGPAGPCGPAAASAQRLVMDPDEAYAAGLLHDIGKAFFAASRPQLWDEVEEIRQARGISFHQAEDAYWGMDHALIGAQVLHYWKLPLLLTDPINWHHAPDLAPALGMEARVLAAANRIAHGGLTVDGCLQADAASLMPDGCDVAGLGAAVRESLSRAPDVSTLSLLS